MDFSKEKNHNTVLNGGYKSPNYFTSIPQPMNLFNYLTRIPNYPEQTDTRTDKHWWVWWLYPTNKCSRNLFLPNAGILSIRDQWLSHGTIIL